MAADTQGSWYPTSFHGHFRSKHRNDFVNEYRQQAKPSPPGKFVGRLTSRPTMHQFSHHDNRFSFLNTVTSFQDGLGKKKVQSAYKSKFIPDFIAWVPHKKEINQAGPLESVYRDTFRDSDRQSSPQILVNTIPKPKAVIDMGQLQPSITVPYNDPIAIDPEDLKTKPVTTYEFTHRHMQPNRNIQTNMNTGTVENTTLPLQKTATYINPQVPSIYERPKTSLTRLRRIRISSAPNMRSSVADCLRWYNADEDNDSEKRPNTASGCFPALPSPNSNTQLNFTGSNTAPTLPSTQMSFQNGNHSNQQATTAPASYDYVKTSRVPATQIVQSSSTQPDLGNSSSSPVTDSQPVQAAMEEG